MSASKTPTALFRRFISDARRPVTMDLPTPPLPLSTAMVFPMDELAFRGFFNDCFFSIELH